MPLTLDEADGYLELIVPLRDEAGVPRRDADGAPQRAVVWLDLYEANNKYAQLCDEFDPQERPLELQRAWLDWLTLEKGVPPLSMANGLRALAAVVEGVAAFKKKHGPGSATAGSAGTSTSPGSPAPSAT